MAMFSSPENLPDDLIPYAGKLSERFYTVRQNVAEFCQEIKSVEESMTREGYNGLRAKAKARGLWNFFLPMPMQSLFSRGLGDSAGRQPTRRWLPSRRRRW